MRVVAETTDSVRHCSAVIAGGHVVTVVPGEDISCAPLKCFRVRQHRSRRRHGKQRFSSPAWEVSPAGPRPTVVHHDRLNPATGARGRRAGKDPAVAVAGLPASWDRVHPSR